VIDTRLVRDVEDTTRVVQDFSSVDTAGNGTTSIDFGHHGLFTGDGAVLSNSGVGEGRETDALTTVFSEGRAGTAGVHSIARPVSVTAEAFRGVRRAGGVGHAGFVGDEAVVLDEFEGGTSITTIARTGLVSTTVEDVLNREVDVDTTGLAGDLDTISEGRHSTMGPAGTTVLRDVLVARFSGIRDTIDVAPVEVGGEGVDIDVGGREGGSDDGLVLEARHVLTVFRTTLGSSSSTSEGEEHEGSDSQITARHDC